MKYAFFILFCLISFVSFSQTEPSNQPSALNFSGLKTYRTNVSFTSSSADGYLVVASQTPISFSPVDNVNYIKGEVVGAIKVVAVGNGTFVSLKNLLQNNTYYVAVYAYNTSGFNINYKSDNPLSSSFTTPSASYGNYYNGIDFTAGNVIEQLTNKIQAHTSIEYAQFDETIVADFYETDTVIGGVGRKYVNCQYSNEKRLYDGTFAYTNPAPSYSREHRMAFSWINFQGITRAEFELTPEGNDIHSLDLVQNDVNSARSNYPFGIVTSNPWADSYLEFIKGRDVNNDIVAEPRSDRKGDIARAVFYMMLAYNGKYGENWGLDNLLSDANLQDIQVLLDWHYQDLPDDFEKTRHQYVAEKQLNRNPFIDFPQLVDCIDFTNLTKKAACNVIIEVGIKESPIMNYGNFVYPNPSNGTLYIQDLDSESIIAVKMFDYSGKELKDLSRIKNVIYLDSFSKGLYLIEIQTTNGNYMSKIHLK
ncbi:MAG: endonuclease [Chitinophagales bacterium]|nr:endonuclease [Chitinophagales bacterium]